MFIATANDRKAIMGVFARVRASVAERRPEALVQTQGIGTGAAARAVVDAHEMRLALPADKVAFGVNRSRSIHSRQIDGAQKLHKGPIAHVAEAGIEFAPFPIPEEALRLLGTKREDSQNSLQV